MKYTLQQNLGLDDAKFCNDKYGASLPIDVKKLVAGETVELSEAAHKYLTVGKGYIGLFEATTVRGEAKKPEITAPAK